MSIGRSEVFAPDEVDLSIAGRVAAVFVLAGRVVLDCRLAPDLRAAGGCHREALVLHAADGPWCCCGVSGRAAGGEGAVLQAECG